jgi:hypothetical protein
MPMLQKKPLIDFVYALSSLRPCVIPRIRNQLFSQSYDSCLQSRSAPSPSSPLSSQSSPPCIRLDIYFNAFTISSIHSSPSSSLPPRLSHITVGNFQLLSTRLRQCILVFRSYYLLIYSQFGFQLPPTLPCSYPRQ